MNRFAAFWCPDDHYVDGKFYQFIRPHRYRDKPVTEKELEYVKKSDRKSIGWAWLLMLATGPVLFAPSKEFSQIWLYGIAPLLIILQIARYIYNK